MPEFSNIIVSHAASGAKAEIHPWGATVVGWYPAGTDNNRLFVSSSAKLDGSKAIRGGIPLVFPQFGQPDKSFPQHGFLRNNLWTVVEGSEKDEEEAGASISLSLNMQDAVNSRGDTGPWSAAETTYDCKVTLDVLVKGDMMKNTLKIVNTKGEEMPFPFQTLFHTYYKVVGGKALDGTECNVKGLEGYTNDDKITGTTSLSGDDPITIVGNVDRVYGSDKTKVSVTIATGGGTSTELEAFGTVDSEDVPVSCVVWNPYEEKAKAMSDFTDDQYHDMICVEPGLLNNPLLKSECTFTQVMTAKL